MKITKISLYHLRTPLRIQFAQANQQTQRADSVVVRLQSAEGSCGYGEACPRTYVTGESAQTLMHTISKEGKKLLQHQFQTIEDIEQWSADQLSSGRGGALVCALELALLDAWCWEYQRDLREELQATRSPEEVEYSGVLPFGNWRTLEPIVAGFAFRSWKIKAADTVQANTARITEMQATLGKHTPIRMDANGGWSYELACQQIEAGLELGVNSFEQPLAAGSDKQSHQLVEKYGAEARIMADESLCTLNDAQRLIDRGACNHFSLKLSKNGGLFNALRIYQLAKKNGVHCQMSAHYGETSILSSAGLLFATLAPDLTACEGALGTYLLREDITKMPLMVDRSGRIAEASLPFVGWPLAVDELSLNRNSVRTEAWTV